jgi:hypothetical protein
VAHGFDHRVVKGRIHVRTWLFRAMPLTLAAAKSPSSRSWDSLDCVQERVGKRLCTIVDKPSLTSLSR